jgi:hypothetical protein
LVLEDLDAEVDDGVLFSSSFSLALVEFAFLLEVSNGAIDGVDGFLPDSVGLSLSSKCGGLLHVELLKVLLFAFNLLVEVCLFCAGVTDPFSKSPCGGNFGGLEVGKGVIEVVLKVNEDVVDLFSERIALLLLTSTMLIIIELHEFLDGVCVEEVAVHQ